ncbi:pilus assembly protein [Pseudonocardia kujensis]|uniref:TadE family type IV pilus minor pilin n=1 Tax=Pseudonocardia kujensis TaxID=1128675 RepID=UPI001E5A0A3C|nr:TadE family type IV pilus minor pilin [Pseudonocardia kujensis]MCE0768350.1 pilus assembly protein [Pseudonocardia kujensis]
MRPAERGAVTVEAAIALSALTLVVLAALGAVATVAAAVRCTDAARELVRLAARGEADRGRAAAAALAPGGAVIELSTTAEEVRAVVSAAPVGPLPIRVSGRAVGAREPGAALSSEAAA